MPNLDEPHDFLDPDAERIVMQHDMKLPFAGEHTPWLVECRPGKSILNFDALIDAGNAYVVVLEQAKDPSALLVTSLVQQLASTMATTIELARERQEAEAIGKSPRAWTTFHSSGARLSDGVLSHNAHVLGWEHGAMDHRIGQKDRPEGIFLDAYYSGLQAGTTARSNAFSVARDLKADMVVRLEYLALESLDVEGVMYGDLVEGSAIGPDDVPHSHSILRGLETRGVVQCDHAGTIMTLQEALYKLENDPCKEGHEDWPMGLVSKIVAWTRVPDGE